MRLNRFTLSGMGLALVIAGGCELFTKSRNDPKVTPVSELSPEQQERITSAAEAKGIGDYDRALSLFLDILAENPTVTTAYLGIGEIYMIREDYERAEPAYARAARLEPRNFDAQYGHALALHMLSRFVEAVRAYHRALTIDPDSVMANLNLATTYLQMNEPRSAIVFAERVVELDPANGPARINLGAAYETVGRNREAVAQYTAALELVEETPPLMMNLITVLAREKRYQEAVNTAENLVRIVPSANAYERLGWCYFRLGEYDKSITAYRNAVQVDAYHWPSYNGVGVNALNTWLLSKKRDQFALREARESFRTSLRVNPDQPKVITIMSNYGL